MKEWDAQEQDVRRRILLVDDEPQALDLGTADLLTKPTVTEDLVARIVESRYGSVTVESSLGGSSPFSVFLPVAEEVSPAVVTTGEAGDAEQ